MPRYRGDTRRDSASHGANEIDDAEQDLEGVKSVEVAGRLLRAFVSQTTHVSLNEIARLAGMSPSKAHRYLASLIKIGLVDQSLKDRRYGLGRFSIELGAVASRLSDPVSDAMDRLRYLGEELDETLTLAVWSSSGPLIIEVEESSRPIVMTMKRGTVLPLLNTATGLVFCSFLPASQIETLVSGQLDQAPASNPIAAGKDELQVLAARVREQGYALNAGHLLPDVMALAAPIFDRSNALIAVLAAFGRDSRIDPARNPSALAALLRATKTPLTDLRVAASQK
jgi:DNA-binding IclR family transcriptional regulator